MKSFPIRAACVRAGVALVLVTASLATVLPARAQGLVADGKTPDAVMLFTGDVIGYIDPCG